MFFQLFHIGTSLSVWYTKFRNFSYHKNANLYLGVHSQFCFKEYTFCTLKKRADACRKKINSVNCIIRILRKNVYYERDIKFNSLHRAPPFTSFENNDDPPFRHYIVSVKQKQAKTTIQNRHCCFTSHALALVGGWACWAAGAGAVRHEAGKLRKVYLSVAVQVGLRNHGLDLRLRQRLPEVVHRQSELLLRDEAVSVAIEDLRGGSFSQKKLSQLS